MGGIFYPYLVTPIIAGRLSERFGAKWITASGVFVPAILASLTPWAADVHVGLVIAIRVLIGCFNGCVYASLFSLYSNWFPITERASAIGSLATAGNIGLVIVFPVAGYLIKSNFLGGWPSVFYVTTLIHIPWFLLWCYYVTNSPHESNKISQEELEYIQKSCASSSNSKVRLSCFSYFSITFFNHIFQSHFSIIFLNHIFQSYFSMIFFNQHYQ